MSILMAATVVALTAIPTHDLEVLEGSFDARLDRPYLNLSITTDDHGYANWGRSLERSDIRELRVGNGRISFKVTRPAGTLVLEGKGSEVKLRGTFEFRPNDGYRKQLAALGYTGLNSERLFVLAMAELSVADVRFLDQATSTALTTNHLVQLLNHGVDVAYVKGMADAGFRNLSVNELITARTHGVTPHYIHVLKKYGYDVSLRDYVRAKDHGVSERYVAELRDLEFDLVFEELIRSRSHGIDGELVREFMSQGYEGLTLDEYIRLRPQLMRMKH